LRDICQRKEAECWVAKKKEAEATAACSIGKRGGGKWIETPQSGEILGQKKGGQSTARGGRTSKFEEFWVRTGSGRPHTHKKRRETMKNTKE